MSNASNPFNALPAPVAKLIAKMADDSVKARRAELGQNTATFEVDSTVVLHATGEVSVAKATPDAVIAQKAEPWKLLAVALEEANRQLVAAGKVGIDLNTVVEMAENADPELVKKAKKKATDHLKAIKDEVRGFKWGSVTARGEVKVLASQNNLESAETA
jgi:hypothetical protein